MVYFSLNHSFKPRMGQAICPREYAGKIRTIGFSADLYCYIAYLSPLLASLVTNTESSSVRFRMPRPGTVLAVYRSEISVIDG
jgi:hypothetical protein